MKEEVVPKVEEEETPGSDDQIEVTRKWVKKLNCYVMYNHI